MQVVSAERRLGLEAYLHDPMVVFCQLEVLEALLTNLTAMQLQKIQAYMVRTVSKREEVRLVTLHLDDRSTT